MKSGKLILALPFAASLACAGIQNSQSPVPINVSELRVGRYAKGGEYCDLMKGRSVGCALFSESYTNNPRDDPGRFYKTMGDGNGTLIYLETDTRRHRGIFADMASTPEELRKKAELQNWHKEVTERVLLPENFQPKD